MDKYLEFVQSKRHSVGNHGIDINFLPDSMFDYQKYVTEHGIKKGRCALFLDTGLGKTVIELTIAYNYVRHTNKPALIITPLAVAFQFIREAAKFGIDDVEYSKDGKFSKKIVITNYERLEYFNPVDFDCVILDESSILKNFEGSIKNQVTAFLKRVKYRYLFTATPSPNDFIELGTSSEALGYMGYTDMLTKFFKNNEDTISPMNIGTEWVLKGHAREAFFQWVSGWSISMRRPSDLGFSDKGYELPELIVNEHRLTNEHNMEEEDGQVLMFAKTAQRLKDVRTEQKLSTENRCAKAVELAQGSPYCVYWTNLNTEADLIGSMDKEAVEIRGSMSLDAKEEVLKDFSDGNIKRLITKPKITAFGLNWQHCAHTVYFPTFSYEQYYQAVRRFWRFGQTQKVTVDLVFAESMQKIIESLNAKGIKANELFSKLNAQINSSYELAIKPNLKTIKKPTFLK